MIPKQEQGGFVLDSAGRKHLEDVVAAAEREIQVDTDVTKLNGMNGSSPLLVEQARKVAEFLWVYQYAPNGAASCNNGCSTVSATEESKLLISRAQDILHQWRLSLEVGDTVHCPDYLDEYDDEKRGFVRLYCAKIKQVASAGSSVLVGDSSCRKPYKLLEDERAVLVHYEGYPVEEDNWIVIKRDSLKSMHVIPKDSHLKAKRALYNDDPSVLETRSIEDRAIQSSGHMNGATVAAASLPDTRNASVGSSKRKRESPVSQQNGDSTAPPSKKSSKEADHAVAVKPGGQKEIQRKRSAPASKTKTGGALRSSIPVEKQDPLLPDVAPKAATSLKPETASATNILTPSSDPNHDPTEASVTTEPDSSSRRSRRKRATPVSQTKEDNKKPRPAKKKPPKSSKATKLDMTWICTECNEAECLADLSSDLLICEGKCQRPFHSACVNLQAMPSEDETWICSDCKKGRHMCTLCQEYGTDDDDVFLCDKEGCGLFFHESCLSMQNVEVLVSETKADGETNGENGFTSKPQFICPAHSCWTCTEDFVPPEEDEGQEQSKKKSKKKDKRSACFAQKRDKILHRCLHCPIAYHITCIPPLARFHELCLLCHEHAATCKLPDLDVESSMQKGIEAQVEKQLARVKAASLVQNAGQKPDMDAINPFIPGVAGDTLVAQEERFMSFLQKESPEHEFLTEGLSFCLPCDIQEEVHAKPPSYRHVHALRYDPSNRPKRLPPSDGTCECKKKGLEICDENCLNRMMMIECIGDVSKSNGEKNPYWNCNLGPSCTNRSISLRDSAKCKPKREQGKGWGLIAVNGVKKGGFVQEYAGEVIDEKEKMNRLQEWSRDHPNDSNFYVMQLDTGWYIDARHMANLSRFINHSCEPNCKLARVNVNGYMRVGIFSLRDIQPGEFLLYDYQFDTKHGDKFSCRCGAKKCRGTMKGGKVDEAVEFKSKKEELADAKARYERDKKFLEETQEREAEKASQVDSYVPGSDRDNAMELVAAGPNRKTRKTALEIRVFLWRNVQQGGDFASRAYRKAKAKRRKKSVEAVNTTTVDLLGSLFHSNGKDNDE